MMYESSLEPARVELPYPKIEVERPNRVYAGYMLDNMGGIVSEMSSIGIYTYQHILLDKEVYEKLLKELSAINITELEHVEIFGKLVKLLGSDPRIWSQKGSRPRYWSPNYIKYPRTLEAMLRYNIQEEEKTIQKYRQQAAKIKDKYIVQILERIILDEELHVEILKDLYREYC